MDNAIEPNAQKKITLKKIFFGPNGIRAGWGILIFLAVFMAVVVGLSTLLHLSQPKDEIPILFSYLGESTQIVAMLIAMAVVAKVEGKSIWSYGLSGSKSVKKFLIGWGGGFVMLSILVGMLYLGGYLVIDGFALQGLSIASYGVIWLGGFLLVAVAEELLFRGYLLNALERGIGRWPAFALLAALFAAAHYSNNGESVVGLIAVAAAGFLLCILRWKSGSLWLGIGMHAAWDWSQSFLYSTPDSGLMVQSHMLITHAIGDVTMSGGKVGPEGSLLAQPVMLLGLLTLIWICRKIEK